MTDLLDIDHLGLAYRSNGRELPVLHDLSFSLAEGERLAILGESGSGKSSLALAIAGLLPPGAQLSGAINWPGLKPAPVAARDIGFIFQDPAGSLDPLMRVGNQIAEVLRAHGVTHNVADRTIALLDRVRLPDPPAMARAWPHQLSGGQKQRIAIACAIATSPRLLIADEATSALDTVVQAKILDLLQDLATKSRMSLMLITHDIAIAAQNADRIIVLRNGRLIESGSADQVISAPQDTYTKTLVASQLWIDRPAGAE
ncbi:ABC transporter ATP-binding protein [Escherichia coli]|nr:ABC transporter ATP-binding protein [Salmonella enterica subsp. enterica]EFG2885682.1 ABC transporter ATP-binding protein [Escherichia coli]MIL08885.1 ABC transporter ATP-binding protein [Salmonella enterica subsp. enterica serovar Enteritidis]